MWKEHLLFQWLFGYEQQRKRLLKKAPDGPLKQFLSVPFVDPDKPLDASDILSVDFETTGLDPIADKLLSVGFVTLSERKVHLGSSYHQIINTRSALRADNVKIHHITDSQQEQGESLEKVIEALLSQLAGKIMLVHFATIEYHFLRQACLQLYGMAPVWPIIDTLAVAKRKLDQRDVSYDPSQLRLSALRQRYGLPEHYAHNALNDAIATAELLLAQSYNKSHLPIKHWLY